MNAAALHRAYMAYRLLGYTPAVSYQAALDDLTFGA